MPTAVAQRRTVDVQTCELLSSYLRALAGAVSIVQRLAFPTTMMRLSTLLLVAASSWIATAAASVGDSNTAPVGQTPLGSVPLPLVCPTNQWWSNSSEYTHNMEA